MANEEMAAMADWDAMPSFDEKDRLVLRFSEVLTRENRVSDELYAELEQHFSREELVELGMTVGLSALVNRMHATFRTDVDDSTRALVGDGPVCPIGR